jgi:hypothetical protein
MPSLQPRRSTGSTGSSRLLRSRVCCDKEGSLVLMWNLPATPWEPSIEAVEEYLSGHVPNAGKIGYDPFDLGSVMFTSGEWRLAFEDSAFENLREKRLSNPQTLDREGLVAFFASMGWIADLPEAERLPLLEEVRSRLAANTYRRKWETSVYWTRLARKAVSKPRRGS